MFKVKKFYWKIALFVLIIFEFIKTKDDICCKSLWGPIGQIVRWYSGIDRDRSKRRVVYEQYWLDAND